ncbi:MAG: hypothetical protein ACK41C_09215 [Phenylobacterium sp.]|uniref:hypothetical protein n=1 Tax=Phenylobacterium sp. TaxID=1871053 RepID=UPI00391B8DA6
MAKIRRAAPEPADRRISPRVRTADKARVVADTGEAWPCVIKDRSDGGSRLLFRAPVTLPPMFTLVKESDGASRRVRLVWTAANEAGVAFAD